MFLLVLHPKPHKHMPIFNLSNKYIILEYNFGNRWKVTVARNSAFCHKKIFFFIRIFLCDSIVLNRKERRSLFGRKERLGTSGVQSRNYSRQNLVIERVGPNQLRCKM